MSSLWWENLGKGCRNVGISGAKDGGNPSGQKIEGPSGQRFWVLQKHGEWQKAKDAAASIVKLRRKNKDGNGTQILIGDAHHAAHAKYNFEYPVTCKKQESQEVWATAQVVSASGPSGAPVPTP